MSHRRAWLGDFALRAHGDNLSPGDDQRPRRVFLPGGGQDTGAVQHDGPILNRENKQGERHGQHVDSREEGFFRLGGMFNEPLRPVEHVERRRAQHVQGEAP